MHRWLPERSLEEKILREVLLSEIVWADYFSPLSLQRLNNLQQSYVKIGLRKARNKKYIWMCIIRWTGATTRSLEIHSKYDKIHTANYFILLRGYLNNIWKKENYKKFVGLIAWAHYCSPLSLQQFNKLQKCKMRKKSWKRSPKKK